MILKLTVAMAFRGCCSARIVTIATIMSLSSSNVTSGQTPTQAVTGRDTVSVRIVDTDLRSAVALLARYVDKPVLIASGVGAGKVTLETSHAVPRSDVVRLLRGLVESQGLRMVEDTVAGLFRVEAVAASPSPAAIVTSSAQGLPISVLPASHLFILRLRHARATDVAATINALYGRSSAIGELGARTETLSEQVRRGHPLCQDSCRITAGVIAPG